MMFSLKAVARNCFTACSQAIENAGFGLYAPSPQPLEKLFNTAMLATCGLAGMQACLTGDARMAGLTAAAMLLPLNRLRQEGAVFLRDLPPPQHGYRCVEIKDMDFF
jgi:hypothetical protein